MRLKIFIIIISMFALTGCSIGESVTSEMSISQLSASTLSGSTGESSQIASQSSEAESLAAMSEASQVSLSATDTSSEVSSTSDVPDFIIEEIYPTISDVLLVNFENAIPSDFVPDNLVKIGTAKTSAQSPAASAMILLVETAKTEKSYILTVFEGYRSYEQQKIAFDRKVIELTPEFGENAEIETSKQIAYPGKSEHQTGLAIDIGLASIGKRQSFGDTPEGKWLAENCHRFGFIIRYPKDKTEITHIMYEPWHLRFVGVTHATTIYEQRICLEEYLD